MWKDFSDKIEILKGKSRIQDWNIAQKWLFKMHGWAQSEWFCGILFHLYTVTPNEILLIISGYTFLNKKKKRYKKKNDFNKLNMNVCKLHETNGKTNLSINIFFKVSFLLFNIGRHVQWYIF